MKIMLNSYFPPYFYRQVLEAKAALYEKMARGEIEGDIFAVNYY